MFKVILLSIVLLTSSGKSNKPELNTSEKIKECYIYYQNKILVYHKL